MHIFAPIFAISFSIIRSQIIYNIILPLLIVLFLSKICMQNLKKLEEILQRNFYSVKVIHSQILNTSFLV